LINPLLFEIEQKNLIDPLNLGAWSADLTNQSFLEISQLKPVSVSATIPMCNTFVEMRRELFQKITDHSEGSVVEVLDLREFKKEILAYSSAYLSMLKGIREKLTSTTTDSGINNILSQNGKIQRIDTVHITLGSNDSTDEVVLLAPTHPLRMLWILQYQELLYSWGSKLVGLTDDQARAAISLESLKEITSLNIPSALSFANKEFYVNSDNIDLYWSILPKSTTRDIRKVVTQLMRSLGFKNQQEEITSIGPEAIADRIWRYLKHHPYVTTLKLNVINPGDGNVVLNTIRHLQRMDDFKDLHYDIAFYGDLGHELMGSAFDDIMDEGGSSEFGVSDIDEELLIPNNNPLFPKLFFSKIRLTDDEWLRKEIREAHISIVIDRFSTRTFTRKQLHERGSFFLHNILAEYRSDFSVEKESATWSRKVIPNPNIEMIDGEITASLIYSIVDNFLRFSCCLHDADASFEKLPAIQLELSDVDKHIINSIHEKSDWVFTIDRNFGIEYFDNPINSKKSVKSYLIDYTPEFIDGVGHRLIVSTYWLLEIEALIGNALKQIGVPASGYQATRILDIIKSISGKLALKLINNPNNVKEIIGLALTKLFLEKSGRLNDAIIIPVDSHIDLFAEYKRGGDEELSLSRSDLLLIQAKGNTLHWALIEVKFRTVGTNLAEILNLKEAIVLKNENTQKVITKRFGENPSSVRIDKPLTNKSLSNLINFYLERALRHSLDGKQQHQLEGLAHILEKIESDRFEMDFSKEGFILSWAGASRPVDNYKGNDIHIIGRREIALLLDIGEAQTIENEQVVLPVDEASVESGKPVAAVGRKRREVGKGRPQSGPATVPLEYLPQSSVPQVSVKVEETTSARRIFLGKDCDSGKPMYWDPFTLVPKKLANQHILIVGKPGSGKSQSASSFMYELEKNNVPFIVFDFQGEYITPDHTNGSAISFVNLTKSKILDAAEGIELNPLEVPVDLFTGQKQSFTKTVYQVSSTLNKIFGLGEIQYSILRRAINQAFIECGFSVTDKSTWSGRAPSLEQVWKILQHIEKTEGGSSRNLILRIQPLFDTGVFRDQDSQSSFSELFKQNTIVRLSSLPTVELMVSVSRFVLQKIYNEMLTLGPTKDLRMFVVIDEAHKLSYDETLTELIREARKYGVGIMLASQSVRDFDLVVFDAVGTKICLQLEGDNAKIMADNFGLVDAQQRKQIHQMILNQKSGTALIRNNHFEPFRQIDLEQFWQKL
jgi:Cdc6-like AAA superfamily ATPase